jgi:hypothetical protein
MSRCGSCNRPLRDARSIELGFGPGCWARLGFTEREAVRASLRVAAEEAEATRPAPVGSSTLVASAAPAPDPAPPERSDSALAVVASWVVGLTLVLALLLFWRWLLLGIGIMGATAATGLLIEHLQERRIAIGRMPTPNLPRLVRSVSREADEIATAVGSPTRRTTPSGAL